jgi:hypothetical protein
MLVDGFERWLRSEADVLASHGSVDMHIDVLVPGGTRAEWVLASVRLFAELVQKRPDRLQGMTLLLHIPMSQSQVRVPRAPAWSEVLADDCTRPPSLYVEQQWVHAMPWGAERTVSPIEFPIAGEFPVGKFVCWRLPDDPPEDGWVCDVRFERCFFG